MMQGKDLKQEIEQEIRKDIRQIRQFEETAVEQLELQMAAISDRTRRIWRHIQRPVATLCAFVMIFNTIPVHAYAAEEGTESILTEAVPDLTSDPLTQQSLFSEPDPAAVTVPETAAPELTAEPTLEPASALESLLQEPAPAPEPVQEQVSVQPETPQTTATEYTEPVTDPSSGTGIGIVENPMGSVDQNSTDTSDTSLFGDSSNIGSPEEEITEEQPEEAEADPIEATRTYYFIVRDEEVSRQIVKNGDTLSRPDTPASYEAENEAGETRQYIFEAWYIEDTEDEPPFGVIDDIPEDAPENEDILVIASFAEQPAEEEERIEATRTYHFLSRDEEVSRQTVKNGNTLFRPATPGDYKEEDAAGETHRYTFEAWYIEDTKEEPPFGVIDDIPEDAPESEDIIVTAVFEEKEEEYPAQTFTGSTSQVRVEAESEEGVFPENTTMEVKAVSRADAMEAAQEAIDADPDREQEVVDAVAVDITFYNEDGEEIQPLIPGGVRVTLHALRAIEGEAQDVAHMENLLDATQPTETTILNDAAVSANVREDAAGNATSTNVSASFDAPSFSVFAIIGTVNPVTGEETGGTPRRTYYFYVDQNNNGICDGGDVGEVNGEIVDQGKQIVTNGDRLIEPAVPSLGQGQVFFHGWEVTDESKSDTLKTGDLVSFDVLTDIEGYTGPDGKKQDEVVYARASYEAEWRVIFYGAHQLDVYDEINHQHRKVNVVADSQVVPVTGGERKVQFRGNLVLTDSEEMRGWVNRYSSEKGGGQVTSVEYGEDSEYYTIYPKDASITILEDNTVFYPLIRRIRKIAFEGNGPSASFTEPVTVAPDTKTLAELEYTGEGDAPAGQWKAPSRTGFVFDGWYTSKEAADALDESGKYNVSEIITAGNTLTLYAGWRATEVKYTIYLWKEIMNDDGSDPEASGQPKRYGMVHSWEGTAEAGKTFTGTELQSIFNSNFKSNLPEDRFFQLATDFNTLAATESVRGDGSTEFHVYYDCRILTLTFINNNANTQRTVAGPPGAKVPVGTTVGNKNTYVFHGKYGQYINDLWPDIETISGSMRYDKWTTFTGTTKPGYYQNYLTHIAYLNEYVFCDKEGYTARTWTLYLRNTNEVVVQEYWLESVNQSDTGHGANEKQYNAGDGLKWYTSADETTSYNYNQKLYTTYWQEGKQLRGFVYPPLEWSKDFGDDYGVKNQKISRNYYKRQSYNLTFTNWDQIVPTSGENGHGGSFKYEADLTDVYWEPKTTGTSLDAIKDVEYEFKGWYSDPAFKNKFEFNGAKMPDNDLELFACWEPKDVTVHFDSAGGTHVADQTIEMGGYAEEPREPTKPNSQFLGWYLVDQELAANYSGSAINFENRKFYGKENNSEDPYGVTLYAWWIDQGAAYKIVYKDEFPEHAVPEDPNEYRSNAHFEVLKSPNAAETHEFRGWRLEGETKTYLPGTVLTLDSELVSRANENNEIEFWAFHGEPDKEKVTITYDSNYPAYTGLSNTQKEHGIQLIQNAETTRLLSFQDTGFTDCAPQGYVFKGWNTTAEGDGTFLAAGTEVFADEVGTGEGKINMLYAQWEAQRTTYKIEFWFEDRHGVFQHGAFEGEGNDLVVKDITRDTTVSAEVTTDPANYTFAGYSYVSREGEKLRDIARATYENGGYTGTTVLTLFYERARLTPVYRYEGAVPAGVSPSMEELETLDTASYRWGETVTVGEAGHLNGYTFDGWKLNGTGESYKEGDTFPMPASGATLTGTFIADNVGYKIEHFQEMLSSDVTDAVTGLFTEDGRAVRGTDVYYRTGGVYYRLADTDTKDGETDAEGSVGTSDIRTYPGFTADADHSVRTGTIAVDENGNGTLVLTMLYNRTRNTAHFYFDANPAPSDMRGTVKRDGEEVVFAASMLTEKLPADQTYAYGETVDVNTWYTAGEDMPQGYAFKGWMVRLNNVMHTFTRDGNGTWTHTDAAGSTYENANTFEMPAGGVNIAGSFTVGLADYKIIHYLELDEDADPTADDVINEDGKYYLAASEYWRFGGSAPSQTTGAQIGSDASARPQTSYTSAGYTYDHGEKKSSIDEAGTSADSEAGEIRGTVLGDNSLEFHLYYTRKADLKLTYIIDKIGEAKTSGLVAGGNFTEDADTAQYTPDTAYRFGQRVTLATPEALGITVPAGYTIGWHVYEGKFNNTSFVTETDPDTGRVLAIDMPGRDVRVHGELLANKHTKYTVTHYREVLTEAESDVTTTEDGTETYWKIVPQTADTTGATGETVTVSERAGELFASGGYAFDHSVVKETGKQDVTQGAGVHSVYGVITGDEKLAFEFYYRLKTHKVTYKYESHYVGTARLPEEKTYRYGETVTIEALAALVEDATDDIDPGYQFTGWEYGDRTMAAGQTFTMPDGDVLIIGVVEARGDIRYTVEHYLQDANGAYGNTPAWSYTRAGETGKTAEAEPNAAHFRDTTGSFETGHYTFDEEATAAGQSDKGSPAYAGGKVTGTVQGDGSLVLRFYYERDSYGVTYRYDGTEEPDGAPDLSEAEYNGNTNKYVWGSSVRTAPAPSVPGYTFDGWYLDGAKAGETFTMPDRTSAIVLTGSFRANSNTGYTVEHFKEILESEAPAGLSAGRSETDGNVYYVAGGRTYLLADTEEMHDGITNQTITIGNDHIETYEGFSFDSANSIRSGKVTVDAQENPELVLTLLYNRDKYTLSFNFDGHPLPSEMKGTVNGAAFTGITIPDEQHAFGETITPSHWFTEGVDIPAGYTFINWTARIGNNVHTFVKNDDGTWTHTGGGEGSPSGSFPMPAENVQVTGHFRAKTADYKVIHYLELGESDDRTGAVEEAGRFYRADAEYYRFGGEQPSTTTGATVGANADAHPVADYTDNGYVYDHGVKTSSMDENGTDAAGSAGEIKGTVLGDNSLTFHLYYTRKSDLTLTYVIDGYDKAPAGARLGAGFTTSGTSAAKTEENFTYGQAVTLKTAQELGITVPAGYTLGWHVYETSLAIDTPDEKGRVTRIRMPSRNARVHGTFVRETNLTYEVRHYREALPSETGETVDGKEGTWMLVDSYTRTNGQVETSLSAAARDETYGASEGTPQEPWSQLHGYHAEQSMVTGAFEADPQDATRLQPLVLSLFYLRDAWNVEYVYEGHADGASALPEAATYRYGDDVAVPEAPAQNPVGWEFDGWYLKKSDGNDELLTAGGTIPAPEGDLHIAGKFKHDQAVSYTIEYYGETADGDYEPLGKTTNKNGETDTVMTVSTVSAFAPAALYQYTSSVVINYERKNSVITQEIKGDGSTRFVLYYNRTTFPTVYNYKGSVPAGTEPAAAQVNTEAGSFNDRWKWGTEVKTMWPWKIPAGYSFVWKWIDGTEQKQNSTFTMPQRKVEFQGTFTANEVNYTVEHFREVLPAEAQTLADTVTAQGRSESGGSVYYRSGDRIYRAAGEDTQVLTGHTDDVITLDGTYVKNYEGFTFDSASSVRSGIVTVDSEGNGTLQLAMLYNRITNTVHYYIDSDPMPRDMKGTVGEGENKTAFTASMLESKIPADKTYAYGEEVDVSLWFEAGTDVPAGYTFNGWTMRIGSVQQTLTKENHTFTMPAQAVNIAGSFSIGHADYQIIHYLELDDDADTSAAGVVEEDGKYYAKAMEYWRYGDSAAAPENGAQVGSNAYAEPRSSYTSAGYVYDHGEKVSSLDAAGTSADGEEGRITGTVLGDNSLEFHLYYARKADLKITYVIDKITAAKTAGLVVPAAFTDAGNDSVETTPAASYRFGQRVTLATPAALGLTVPAGYTLGWHVYEGTFNNNSFVTDTDKATGRVVAIDMPGRDVRVHGELIPNADTPYTVTHYIEVLDANAQGTTPATTHWEVAPAFQNASGVTTQGSYTLTGETGSSIRVSERAGEMFAQGGYTFDHSVVTANGTDTEEGADVHTRTATITGDGKLAIAFYYTLNAHTVTYRYEGHTTGSTANLPAAKTYHYGETVTVEPLKGMGDIAQGYRFTGWRMGDRALSDGSTFTMPDGDVVITGAVEKRNDIEYTVEHYAQRADGTWPDTPSWSYTRSGTLDDKVGAIPNEAYFRDNTGSFDQGRYAFDRTQTAASQSTAGSPALATGEDRVTGTITVDQAGKGNLILRLYYRRASYSVVYRYEGALPAGAPNLSGAAYNGNTQQYAWGSTVQVAARPGVAGYTFDGWYFDGTLVAVDEEDEDGHGYITMPDRTTNIVLSGSFRANENTPYTIEYFTELLADDVPDALKTADDGRRIIDSKPYYKKNGHFYEIAETVLKKDGITDSDITIGNEDVRDYPGFTLDSANSVRSGRVTLDQDGEPELTLAMLYNRNSYTVTFSFSGHPLPSEMAGTIAGGTPFSGITVASKTHAYGDDITPDLWYTEGTDIPAGYVFEGWTARVGDTSHSFVKEGDHWLHTDAEGNPIQEALTMPAEDVQFEGNFRAGTADYRIIHYLELAPGEDTTATGVIQEGGRNYRADASYWRFGGEQAASANGVPVGSNAQAHVGTDYISNGYVYDHGLKKSSMDADGTNAGTASEISGVVLGDDSLTFELYYTRKTDLTLTYLIDNFALAPAGASLGEGFTTGDAGSAQKTEEGFTFGQTVSLKDATALGITVPAGYTIGWHVFDASIATGGADALGRVTQITMPARNARVHGSFVPDKDTKYQITHYREVIEASGADKTTTEGGRKYYWKKHDSYERTGTTDSIVYASPRTEELFADGGYVYAYGLKTSAIDTTGTRGTGSQMQGTLLGDGSLGFDFHYTLQERTLTYRIGGASDQVLLNAVTAHLPAQQTLRVGETVTVAEDLDLSTIPEASGYEFVTRMVNGTETGWHALANSDLENAIYKGATFTMPNRDVTIIAELRAKSDVPYAVRHYQQRIDPATGQPLDVYEEVTADTQNLTGTTNTRVSVQAKTYPGFTLAEVLQGAGATDSAGNAVYSLAADNRLNGDGSTVLMFLYDRNLYNVTYKVADNADADVKAYLKAEEGGVLGGASVSGALQRLRQTTYPYGATEVMIPVTDADMEVPGYTFTGWRATGTTLKEPSGATGLSDRTFDVAMRDITLTAMYQANENQPYFVKHFVESTEDETQFVLLKREDGHGRTGATIKVAPMEQAGFTAERLVIRDKNHPGANGVTIAATDEDWNDGVIDTVIDAMDTSEVEYYYTRRAHDVSYRVAGDLPETFGIGTNTVITERDVAADGTVNLAVLTRQNVKYGTALRRMDQVTAPGYTFGGWQTAEGSASPAVAADGSYQMPDGDVVFTGTFTANTDTPYTIQYFMADADGKYPAPASTHGEGEGGEEGEETVTEQPTRTETRTGKTGEMADVAAEAARAEEGYELDTAQENVTSAVIKGDGSTVLRLYYQRKAYEAAYSYTGSVPADAPALPETKSYLHGAEVLLPDTDPVTQAAGYGAFTGWSVQDADGNVLDLHNAAGGGKAFYMPVGGVVICGGFVPLDGIAYKIEYYLRDRMSDPYPTTPTETVEKTGVTGDTVTLAGNEINREGYVLDEGKDRSVLEGIVAGDGSLVLKVYFSVKHDYMDPEKEEEGRIITEVVVRQGVPTVHIDGLSKQYAKEELSPDELHLVDDIGDDAVIWIEVTQRNEGSVPEDVPLIEKEAGEHNGIIYMDLSMYKQLLHSDGTLDGDREQLWHLSEWNAGEKVTVSVEVPEQYRKAGRRYKMVRVHDYNHEGSGGKRAETVLDWTSDTAFSFPTGLFCTYALVYTDRFATEDTSKKEQNTDQTTPDTSKKEQGSNQTTPAASGNKGTSGSIWNYGNLFSGTGTGGSSATGSGKGTGSSSVTGSNAGTGSNTANNTTGTGTAAGTAPGSSLSAGTGGYSGTGTVSARSQAGNAQRGARDAQTGEDFDLKLHMMILCAAFVLLSWQIRRLIHDGFLPVKIADEAFQKSHGRHRHVHHSRPHPGKKRPDGLLK